MAVLLIYPSGYSTVGIRDQSRKFVMECKQTPAAVSIASGDIDWPVVLRVKSASKPKSVTVDGQAAQLVPSEEKLGEPGQCWWHDGANGWVVVKPRQGFGRVRIAY